jgi:hypothetical protein
MYLHEIKMLDSVFILAVQKLGIEPWTHPTKRSDP